MEFPKGITEAYRQELLREQRVRRATCKAPLATLTGVVSSQGGCMGLGHRGSMPMLWFRLVAWRLDGGPLSRRQLAVFKLGTERTLDKQWPAIRAHSLVTMRARVLIENEMREPRAQLIRMPIPATDPEFNGIVRELTRPVSVTHPKLGKFSLDRSVDRFTGSVRWRRKRVSASIYVSTERAARARLVRLAKVVENAEWWHEWMKRVVAPRVMKILEGWAEQGFPAPSEEQLLEALSLEDISICEDGALEFVYDMRDYAGGHGAAVKATLAGKLKDLHLIG